MRPATDEERRTRTPRAGDYVHHQPSGEDWVVAYADPERDELSWCGWPAGWANLSDCGLTDVCDDEEHERTVCEIANMSHGDHRVEAVRRLYPEALERRLYSEARQLVTRGVEAESAMSRVEGDE